MFEPGTLWKRLREVSAAALRSGAQRPLPTESVRVEDQGVAFVVRRLSILGDKARERQERRLEEETSGRKFNPFLPYDEALFVGDVTETHVCLLNKFQVIENHLLIVTRAFEEQESLLNLADFEALWRCMFELDALGFYNGGETAGASQAHKHLQMVPLPLDAPGPRLPVDFILRDVLCGPESGMASSLPYVHSVVRFRDPAPRTSVEAAERSLRGYGAMLDSVGLGGGERGRQAGPYNLLVTREWMCLVPRSRECFGTISVNALGFAGSLLVKNDAEMRMVVDAGPMAVLRAVGVPL